VSGQQQVFVATLQRDGGAESVRPVTFNGPTFAYGAAIVGDQVILAVSCADGSGLCEGEGQMLISMPTQ
jgi:hypothetical protein